MPLLHQRPTVCAVAADGTPNPPHIRRKHNPDNQAEFLGAGTAKDCRLIWPRDTRTIINNRNKSTGPCGASRNCSDWHATWTADYFHEMCPNQCGPTPVAKTKNHFSAMKNFGMFREESRTYTFSHTCNAYIL